MSVSHHRVAPTAIVPVSTTTAQLDRSRVAASARLSSIRTALDPTLGVGPTKQRGRVSIEHLLALRDYAQRTSNARAIAVCVLTPLPSLVLSLAIECIPLAPPSLDWRHQSMFWIRLLLTVFAMALLSGLGIKQIAGNAFELGIGRLAAIAFVTAALYVGMFIGISAAWVFPVPFLFIMGSIPFLIFGVLAAFALADIRALLAKVDGFKKRTEGLNSVSAGVQVVFWIYPLYTVLFEFAGPRYQLGLLLILPIFKFQWKKRMCLKLDEVEDLIPTFMMFTVELFNALYLTLCMQSSGSPLTTAVILLLDIVLMLVRMYRLRTKMVGLLATLQGSSGPSDLLEMFINGVCDPATNLNDGALASARVRGNGLEHDLSTASQSMLRTLEEKRTNGATTLHSSRKLSSEYRPQMKSPPDTVVLNQTLQFLFQCEFIVLAEYIECAIPLLYVVYLPIMHGLHNSQFFGHIRALSDEGLRNAVANIVVYWVLESVSLVVMILWLQRHFRVSILHILAFVLDEHFMYVQANILIQMLFSLQFNIAHLGTDFSFKFAWLKDPNATWWVKK